MSQSSQQLTVLAAVAHPDDIEFMMAGTLLRLKQTGARWKVRRVERMATLCAVQASGQWDAYWGKVAGGTT